MRLEEKLHAKGWTPEEIKRALELTRIEEQRKHPFVRFSERSTFWLLLLAAALVSIAVPAAVFPALGLLPFSVSLVAAGLLGSAFGMLFSHALHVLSEHAHRRHALVLAVALTLSLVVSAFVLDTSVWLGVAFMVVFCAHYLHGWLR